MNNSACRYATKNVKMTEKHKTHEKKTKKERKKICFFCKIKLYLTREHAQQLVIIISKPLGAVHH
jgi:hypothetical protein